MQVKQQYELRVGQQKTLISLSDLIKLFNFGELGWLNRFVASKIIIY